MIQHLLKGYELYKIAKYLGVPEEIIQAKPDDGLGVGNGDEDQLGASYPVIDRVMINLIQSGFQPDGDQSQLNRLPTIAGIHPELVRKIAQRCLNGAYKRKGTVVLSRKDLGLPDFEEIEL